MNLLDGVQDINKRVVRDYDTLERLSRVLQDDMGLHIVVTIGTFDLTHVGHLRYLAKAKDFGDVLIVGADSDRVTRIEKGPNRPLWPEDERMETLLHSRYVDWVTIIDDVDEDTGWQFGLLKVVRPQVFVAEKTSYSPEQLSDIKQYCKEMQVLPRQAMTSSSESIRKAVLNEQLRLAAQLRELADRIEAGEVGS